MPGNGLLRRVVRGRAHPHRREGSRGFPAARPVPPTRVAIDDRDLVRDGSTHPESLNRSDWKSATVESSLGLNARQTATKVVVFRPRTAYPPPPSDAQNGPQINATGWIIGIPSTGWPAFATTPTRGGSSPSPYLRPRKCNMSLPGRRCSQVITVIFPCKLEAQLVGTLRDTGRREVRSAQPVQPWAMLGDPHGGAHAAALPPTRAFAS